MSSTEIQKNNYLDGLEFSNRCLYHIFYTITRIPVIKRIYPALQKLWAYLTWTGGYKIKRYRGLFFLLNYRNFLDRSIGMQGGYEHSRCAYLFSKMKSGCDIFLDIGANIGLYSLQVAKLGIAGEIHAFEPDPRNYAQFMGNIYLNKFTDVIHTHELALSSESGLLQFEMASDAKTGNTKVSRKGTTATRQLQAKALDELLSYKNKAIFIKIDVEGHECDTLKGMTQLLRNNRCFLQVEAWPDNVAVVTHDLAALGYKVVHSMGNDYYFSAQ